MLKRDKNLVEVAGGTFVYRVRITKNGGKIGNIKAYGAEMFIGRHDRRDPTLHAVGEFDTKQKNFKIKVPAEETRGMVGNYIYHILVRTPTGHEIINSYGHLSVIPFIKKGSYSDVDWGNADIVILNHIPTEQDVADGEWNTLYAVFGGGREAPNINHTREPWGDSNVALIGRKPTQKDVLNGNSNSLYVIYGTDDTSPSVFEIDWKDVKLQILASQPTPQQVENAPENTLFLVYDINDVTADWRSK